MAAMARVTADTPRRPCTAPPIRQQTPGQSNLVWGDATPEARFLATEEPAYQQLVTQHEAPEIYFEAYKMARSPRSSTTRSRP